ncbi:Crp/Fnr family transcriptional regulator [Oleiphilus messinensis]|uniref:Crp/Fnr family transcriptional regulator n=1 Tax=Oleiphilus messinensis TaxID=141451 RepID=UPI001E34A9F9|nr:cyclic nucleotide-binding domain-containing protein [Oleiphilus messinensis]
MFSWVKTDEDRDTLFQFLGARLGSGKYYYDRTDLMPSTQHLLVLNNSRAIASLRLRTDLSAVDMADSPEANDILIDRFVVDDAHDVSDVTLLILKQVLYSHRQKCEGFSIYVDSTCNFSVQSPFVDTTRSISASEQDSDHSIERKHRKLLSDSALPSSFSEAHLSNQMDLFAGHDRAVVAKDEAIFKRGEPAPYLYLIARGSVNLCVPDHNGTNKPAFTVGPGEIIGEAVLLNSDKNCYDAIAASQDVDLYMVPKQELMSIIAKDESIRNDLMPLASTRMMQLTGGEPPIESIGKHQIVFDILSSLVDTRRKSGQEHSELCSLEWLASQCGIVQAYCSKLIADSMQYTLMDDKVLPSPAGSH